MNSKNVSIIGMIAGIAVLGLTFMLRNDRNQHRTARIAAEKDATDTHVILTTTKNTLAATENKLKDTETKLADTEKDLATTKDTLATTQKDLATTKDTLASTEKSLQETKGALTAANDKVTASEKTIADLNGKIGDLGKEVNTLTTAKAELTEKISVLDSKILAFQGVSVPLPAELTGKVMSVDSKWNFVVLNIGTKEGVRSGGVMVVGRGQDSIGKVKIAIENVLDHMAIANILAVNDPKESVKIGDDVLVMQ